MIRQSYYFQSSVTFFSQYFAMMQDNSHKSERPQELNSNIDKEKQEQIIVQPGDAEQHMLRALAEKNLEKVEGQSDAYKFGQMNQALGENLFMQAPTGFQGYYQQQSEFQGNYQQQWQNNQMPGFYQNYQQNQPPSQYWGEGRGQRRGRGGNFQNQNMDNFYQYHPLPPFHPPFQGHSPYQAPCYMPFQSVPYSQVSERVAQNPCEPVKSVQQYPQDSRPRWRQKRCRQQGGFGGKWKCMKKSRSRSSSSSSQDSDNDSNKMKKKYTNQISEFYMAQMKPFFDHRKINSLQQQKIVKIFKKIYPKFNAPIPKIISSVECLQHQQLLFQMRYAKVIKILLKFNFDLNVAVPRLLAIQQKKKYKWQCDNKFQQKYGNDIEPMVNHHDLIEKDQNGVFYLVDGNNIMPSIKHFRCYFQSRDRRDKIECQVRLRYLISLALKNENVVLFFDQKYTQEEIKDAEAEWIVNAVQMERYKKITVIYGEQEIADNKILAKVQELKMSKTVKEVILVSSDRQLFMKCNQTMKVAHTGGRFFFKMLKVVGKIALKGQKDQKKMFKSVIRGKQ